ncbi:Developmental regulator flbA [Penicillium angulare]|uniref:Developmental regulator flbA n=1 Tax=Penicillium angulare TaxID=116970 RepID=UPI002540453C|nr:Developmental regulator flbA [Penicillium angulare]KAJ5267729.1 Developmental regulator flbA [Penicillium angulare]
MHQSSSRYLRMTEDKRLFARDFMHLFSTLIVSLKLNSHRVHFMRYHHTFTSEEAIEKLVSLKFSQSNWMPDPKDTSRAVTTITTTTFLMDEGMAHSVFQRFIDARLVKAVHGSGIHIFPLKGSLYQITPKGLSILQGFCQRNGIEAHPMMLAMKSSYNIVQLMNMERSWETDKLEHGTTAIEVIFCRFVRNNESEIRRDTLTSGEHSSNGHSDDLVGKHTAAKRGPQHGNVHSHTFNGAMVVDWLLNWSTTIDLQEAYSVAELFVQYNLIMMVKGDRALHDRANVAFQPSK